MPSYSFEVTTAQGVERFAFTLDHDRPLRPQITQVLEELAQRGVVVRGAADEELGVFAQGQALDLARSPAELGLRPDRPLELRMKERAALAGAPDRSLPRGVLASVVLGFGGGFVAWLVAGSLGGVASLAASYFRLDLATIGLLGALPGAAVLGGAALRRRGFVPLGVLGGLVLGGAGAVLGGWLGLLLPGSGAPQGFLLDRIAGWGLGAGIGAAFLAGGSGRPRMRQVLEALASGLVAGAVGGVIFALPGPSELWQAVAFVVTGAGIGLAAAGPALWHSVAVLEGETPGRVVPGILSLREWAVGEGEVAEVDGA